MSEQEKRLNQLEMEFPASAGDAFAGARARALAAGHAVVEADDGALYEVFADGTRKFLKKIKPAVPARRGARFSLK
jgi:hypothetical protein